MIPQPRSTSPSIASDQGRSVWSRPLHPLFASALPVLTVLAQNTLEVDPNDAIRPLLISIVATALLWGLLWVIIRRGRQAALLTSLYVLLFHAYGHLYNGHVQGLIAPMITKSHLVGSHSRLIATFLILAAIATFAVCRLSAFIRAMTVLANAAVISLTLVTFGTVIQNEWLVRGDPGNVNMHSELIAALGQAAPFEEENPDVYYIILDGYARQDVLETFYDFDNTPFLQALGVVGFNVVRDARANYMQTGLSLSSSLNANYLDGLITDEQRMSSSRVPLSRLLLHNQVQAAFSTLGYTTVAVSSGYRPTELTGSDRFFGLPIGSSTQLERLLIENSGLVLLQNSPWAPDSLRFPGYDRHRQNVVHAASALVDPVADLPGPKFVFVHLLIPHPPFVFDAEGAAVQPDYPYVLLDGSAFPGDREGYVAAYRQQLQFTNELVLTTLQSIIDGPAKDALIIVQSDHGPGSGLVWDSFAETNTHERMAILLAVRSPNDRAKPMTAFKTPVNVFRAVFNRIAGTYLPILPEESYFSTWSQPYNFTRVPLEDLHD